MVDKTTPRLGLPVPYLTNPLKIDVGKLTDALTMLDKNAVMLTDWDITSDSWQKMGKISNLAQGKIAITLMVVTGTGFANIVMQTGDGSVTTVGDPARITVTAQTNLGANSATILGGKLVEVAADTYEIWFNIAPSTAPRIWTGLLIAGNGATIDWTHSSGAQPTGGVALNIARSLTDQEIASQTITSDGAVLTAGYAGLMGIKLPYFDFAATGDTITSHVWRVGETMRVKAADATTANGFPAGITGAGATGWRIHCEGINEDRTSTVFTFGSEGATPTWLYRVTRSGNSWSTPRRMYTSDNPPAASEIKAVAQMSNISTVINLNDRILPEHYGIVSLTSATGAVAANNFPFDEVGQLAVFPFGVSGGVTQVYMAKSGKIASRTYDGSIFTDWRKGANAGVNDDITSMTGLTGPFRLGGDGVGDYDAVTMRQLKASSGGSGPTMNGVVNNFIGAVEWWNGSRAKTPTGYVPADGQLLKRADYPEIWAAIKAGILNSVSDALWRGDKNANPESFGKHRAKYSLGYKADGATDGTLDDGETFRMPDLNGVKVDGVNSWTYGTSSPALHLRGDTFGVGGTTEAGTVSRNAAPNITGRVDFYSYSTGNPYGAFTSSILNPNVLPGGNALNFNYIHTEFDASRVAASYGRDGTTEVRPNSAIGIWLIRVGGSFAAASTNFSVFNGDTTLPSNNTALKGGDLRSVYQINGVDHMAVTLRAAGVVGGNYAPEIEQVSPSGGSAITKKWTLPQAAGELVSKAETGYTSIEGKASGSVNGAYFTLQGSNDYVGMSSWNDHGDPSGTYFNGVMHGYPRGGLEIVNKRDGRYGYFLNLTFSRSNGTSTDHRESGLRINADGSTWMIAQPSFGSDIHLKSNITPLGKARDNLRTLRTVTFKMDGLDQMGLIAQDVAPHWPVAVSTFDKEHYEGDKLVKDGTFLSLNYTSMIAPAIKGINENSDILDAVVSALESALSDPEEAKKKLTALRKKFY